MKKKYLHRFVKSAMFMKKLNTTEKRITVNDATLTP